MEYIIINLLRGVHTFSFLQRLISAGLNYRCDNNNNNLFLWKDQEFKLCLAGCIFDCQKIDVGLSVFSAHYVFVHLKSRPYPSTICLIRFSQRVDWVHSCIFSCLDVIRSHEINWNATETRWVSVLPSGNVPNWQQSDVIKNIFLKWSSLMCNNL